MKQFFKIFILLLSTQVYAQNNEVIYIASLNNINVSEKEYTAEEKKTIEYVVSHSADIEYKLFFNTNTSLFQKTKKMKTDDSQINMTELLAGNGMYFFDLKTNETIEQKDAFGKIFLIKKEQLKWNLTEETKKIGNYLCHKATTTISVESRRGTTYKDVIAWYTSEIPLNFGPKNYNGLPGLILKLHEGQLVFNSTKITLNSKEKVTIKKPTKGIEVTQKEFNSLAKELTQR